MNFFQITKQNTKMKNGFLLDIFDIIQKNTIVNQNIL